MAQNDHVPSGFVPAVGPNGVKTHVPPHVLDNPFFGFKTPPSQRAQRSTGAPSTVTPPTESATRDELEAYAVQHAGISHEDAQAFANKAELHAAIAAAGDAV